MDNTPEAAHWTPSARSAVSAVRAARPDLSGAELAMLVGVGELLTVADELMDAARAEGLASTGSKGQLIANPLTTEARMSRTAATAILARLAPPRPAQGSRGGNGRYRPRMDGGVRAEREARTGQPSARSRFPGGTI